MTHRSKASVALLLQHVTRREAHVAALRPQPGQQLQTVSAKHACSSAFSSSDSGLVRSAPCTSAPNRVCSGSNAMLNLAPRSCREDKRVCQLQQANSCLETRSSHAGRLVSIAMQERTCSSSVL